MIKIKFYSFKEINRKINIIEELIEELIAKKNA